MPPEPPTLPAASPGIVTRATTADGRRETPLEPIVRTGPPTPVEVRWTEYDLSVPLNAIPSPEWKRVFQAPDEWKEPCHPSRIRVKDRALLFTSEQVHVPLWIQQIDRWIAAANQKCADPPSGTREMAQGEKDEDRRRRLREATEMFKDL